MSAKDVYKSLLNAARAIPDHVELTKTKIAEDIAIIKKKPLYENIHWSDGQQQQFDSYWKDIYGRKISNKWHRLYESSSGVFSVDYIPEKIYTTEIEPAFNDRQYAVALEDKSVIEALSRECGCIVPETYVVCSKGQLYDHNRKPISISEAVQYLRNKDIVIKPTAGSSSGRGLVFCEKDKTIDEYYLTNLLLKQGTDYIAQARIIQHPMYSVFNPSSINTIRIMTFIVNNSIHHVPLAFRIGRATKNVDNIHAGGLVVGVEDNGRLLPDAYELGYGDKTIKYSEHPDSKVTFEGYELPYIQEIISSAYKVHGRYPHIGIISWDYTVDDKGNVVLIEANIMGQSIWIPQMIHGKGAFGQYTRAILGKSNTLKIERPIRVLCVFGSLDRGGAETMCMNLFRQIDRNEVTFDFVKHTKKTGAYEEEIKKLGGRIYTCPALTTKSYLQYINWWDKHFTNHPEHQIVHGHMFTTSGIYFKVAHKHKRITIGHSHCANSGIGIDERSGIETLVRKYLRDRIADYSDYRFACSIDAGKLVFPNSEFVVLNNAINVKNFMFDENSRIEIRKEFSIPDDYKMIVVIGSIVPVKNPSGVIEICKELWKKSKKWKLVWCGAGSLVEEISNIIAESNLHKQIVLAGVRSDVNKILQGADVFLMPSLYEGLPVSAIEAQAAGIPCFLSDTISQETDITGLCHFLPLEKWGLWADEIIKQKVSRKDTSKSIKEAGYDIETTSRWLQDFYLEIANKHLGDL